MLSTIDFIILAAYALLLIGIAVYSARQNHNSEDYYLGGKEIGGLHIGLSVAATDVGGGFSIGLGALGFTMGMSGSWLLFTGLIGAILSSVFLIPYLMRLEALRGLSTYPQVIEKAYGTRVAKIAAIISFVGYLGFCSSQLLAGAKLTQVLLPSVSPLNILLILAFVTILYTAIGGRRAVVYTDSVQWLVVIVGLLGVAIPSAVSQLGGMTKIREVLDPSFLSFSEISFIQLFNWIVAIVPIWFVGMTLYQRIFACKDEKTAKRAWMSAGLFEWPIMALSGAFLGVLARAAFLEGFFSHELVNLENDSELAIPLLLKNVLPAGLLGLVFAAYISAVLSTADSCLMAASGNLHDDLLALNKRKSRSWLNANRLTLVLGLLALVLAIQFTSVLDLMLYSYSFLISGLFVPTVVLLCGWRPWSFAAGVAMIVGGVTCVVFSQWDVAGLNGNFFGILASAICLFALDALRPILKKDC